MVKNNEMEIEDDELDNGEGESLPADQEQEVDETVVDDAQHDSDTSETDDEDSGETPSRPHVNKGLNKRINELTRKRREAERERDAERARVKELERRLRETESFQSDAEIQAIDAKLAGMAQRLSAARAADDTEEEVKIQREIAEETQRRMVHQARKSVYQNQQSQDEEKVTKAPARPTVVPEVQMLIEANPWLFAPATPEQQQAAMIARRLANQLEAEGWDPHVDPEYAEQMEALLDAELSKRGLNVLQYTYNSQNRSSAAKKGAQSQDSSAKAGPSQRSGLSSSSSVKSAKGPSFKLTASQKELAKLAGMSEAKYAAYLTAKKD